MQISINAVWQNVKESDEVLNGVIQSFLECPYFLGDPTITVAQWRIVYAKTLRRLSYSDVADIEDAKYKIRMGDSNGQIELDALDTRKAAVKLRFPKV